MQLIRREFEVRAGARSLAPDGDAGSHRLSKLSNPLGVAPELVVQRFICPEKILLSLLLRFR